MYENKILEVANIIVVVMVAYFFLAADFDMAWEFNCILNIVNGKLPYKDFNIIVPPLYYYIMAVPVLFCKNIIGYKIASTIFSIILLYVIYNVIKLFNKKQPYLLLIPIVMLTFVVRAHYNTMVTLCGITSGFFIIKYLRTNKKYFMILIGIFCACSILSKQSSGTVITFLIFFYLTIYLFKNKKIKDILYIILPFIGIFLIFLLWLLTIDTLLDFVKFTFLGISSFSRSTLSAIFSGSWGIVISLIILIILMILNIILNLKIKNKEILVLQIIALGNAAASYPIPNLFHNIISIVPFLLTLILLLNQIMQEKIEIKNKHLVTCYFLITICFVTAFTMYGIFNLNFYTGGILKGGFVNDDCAKRTQDIIQYEDKNSEYILYSPEEGYTLHQLYKNKYVGKYLNTFLYGNLGTKDPVNVIKDYEGQENTYMYVYKNRKDCLTGQTPLSVIDYIEENYELVDTTEFYKIYKVKGNIN